MENFPPKPPKKILEMVKTKKPNKAKNKKRSNTASDALDADQEISDFEIAPADDQNDIMEMSASDTDYDQEESIIQKSQMAANRKGKKSGGFQSMGKILNFNI